MFLFINNHFSFYGSYFGMNYSNVIGFFSLLIFFIQFFTGLLSSNYYINYHLSRLEYTFMKYYINLIPIFYNK